MPLFLKIFWNFELVYWNLGFLVGDGGENVEFGNNELRILGFVKENNENMCS